MVNKALSPFWNWTSGLSKFVNSKCLTRKVVSMLLKYKQFNLKNIRQLIKRKHIGTKLQFSSISKTLNFEAPWLTMSLLLLKQARIRSTPKSLTE